ncbi:MAG: dihydroorotate dehydrogenase [Methanobacteriota archaeon]|nr:MAG: dihydroorotate dehydrogenase [Euryarchaeota archaeon]
MTELAVDIAGLRLRNPTMLASGILNETGRSMLEVARAGAGALVTKSVSADEREGHANPCIVEVEGGIINAMGLPNPGAEVYAAELDVARGGDVPVIASVIGGDGEEIAGVAKTLAAAGADAIELNLSCPHAKGLGAEIGSTPQAVREVCQTVKRSVSVPVFAKLTPNTTSIGSLARAAEEGGADGIVAINTLKAMAICPDLRRPVLSNGIGGLSGPAIKGVGVRAVYEISDEVRIPVIGVGGVSDARDALEYIMAGATAVQIGTAIRSRGVAVFSDICEGLERFMDENGCSSLSELVGVAHEGRT